MCLLATAIGLDSPTTADASASDTQDTPADTAADGRALLPALDAAGWGDTWREAAGLTPRAVGVVVTLDETARHAGGVLVTLATRRVETASDLNAILDQLETVDAELVRARVTVAELRRRRHDAAAALDRDRNRLGAVAVALYQGGQSRDDDLLALDRDRALGAERHLTITAATLEEMRRRVETAADALAGAEARLAAAEAQRDALVDTVADLHLRRLTLVAHLDELDTRGGEIIADLAARWILSPVQGAPALTPRALDAYLRAEIVHTLFDPRCRISWATLAAIGGVESNHGTHGGRRLTADGTSDRPIVGLRLDGIGVDAAGETVAAIDDTDGGRYDGDPVRDRAVGPLQIIPGTWQRWGRDGDGDGRADPHDIDDAAMTAAAYLCSYGRLSSWSTWNTAVFGYNHSNAYVAAVKSRLDRLNRLRLGPTPDGYPAPARRPSGPYVPPPPEEDAGVTAG